MFRVLIAGLGGLCALSTSSFAQGTEPEPEVPLGKGAYVGGAPAEMSTEETARQLANPNTPLASLTLKNQWTHWEGSLPCADGLDSQTFPFQPSFPFPINDTDLIFLRPAFPYLADQPVVDAAGHVRSASGFGDMAMDLSFGRTTKSGLVMAAGLITSILAWDSLTANQKKLHARFLGVFAGFWEHTDYEIDRRIARLKAKGLYDNTIII